MRTTADRVLLEELCALRETATEALAKVKRPVVYGISPGMRAGLVAEALVKAMGQRRAAIVRTKLDHIVRDGTGKNSHKAE
jgi:hypothetical protein